MSIKRSVAVTVTSTGSERAIAKLDRLPWRMHEGRMNEAAILSYPYVGLAGLTGIGSYHSASDRRLSTGDIWGYGLGQWIWGRQTGCMHAARGMPTALMRCCAIVKSGCALQYTGGCVRVEGGRLLATKMVRRTE
jgi:hypothetical protein